MPGSAFERDEVLGGRDRGHFCVTAARARGTGLSCCPGCQPTAKGNHTESRADALGAGDSQDLPFPCLSQMLPRISELSTSGEGANAPS